MTRTIARLRPSLASLLAAATLLASPAPAAESEVPPDAAAVIEKHVAWLGGWKALDAVRDVSDEGQRFGVGGAHRRHLSSGPALGTDARVRGEQAATGPDQRMLDHLGPVPQDPAARDQWIDAAGRVAQHHALWGAPAGSALVGPMPPLGNDEYPVTFYAANRAIHDLHRAVGRRSIEREVPGLSL